MPPLRERKDEIPLLFEFLRRRSDEAAEVHERRPIEMSRPLRAFLLEYAYPGNELVSMLTGRAFGWLDAA